MTEKHTHRYEKVIMGKKNTVFFRCNFPSCTHYLQAKLAEGKLSICNRCGNEFILDRRAMKFVKPYCVNCTAIKKKSPEHDTILEFLGAHNLVPESSE
jgi:formylmethanofuran dehydrogenase subunit E